MNFEKQKQKAEGKGEKLSADTVEKNVRVVMERTEDDESGGMWATELPKEKTIYEKVKESERRAEERFQRAGEEFE